MLTRHFKTDILKCHMCILNYTIYTDVLISKSKLVAGNTVAHVYYDGNGFFYDDSIPKKDASRLTLGIFCDTFGIPNKLVYDEDPDKLFPKNKF